MTPRVKRKVTRKTDAGRQKTPIKTPMRPGGRGGALLTGNPGNRGGGRPPNDHVEFCRSTLSDPDCEDAVKAVLTNPKHPAFAAMWKAVADRGYGKAKQSVEMTGKDGAALIPLETLRLAIADAEAVA